MYRLIGAVLLTSTAALALILLPPTECAGGAKAPPWRSFLPYSAYQELVRRSVSRIHTLAKDSDAVDALRAEAVILAGYTISAKDNVGSQALRQSAIQIATLAGKTETAEEGRRLAAALTVPKGGASGTTKGAPTIDWPVAIGRIRAVMVPLASKAKGGEGIAMELQYTVALKKQNNSEALLAALATKKLTATNAGKVTKELELFAYRMATIGALTRRRGPTKNKDDAVQWDEQSVLMRDSAADLADAARKKDITAIMAASNRLVGTCVECHANFK
jgi:hypothetical protein